jgi:hypothetical protein
MPFQGVESSVERVVNVFVERSHAWPIIRRSLTFGETDI